MAAHLALRKSVHFIISECVPCGCARLDGARPLPSLSLVAIAVTAVP